MKKLECALWRRKNLNVNMEEKNFNVPSEKSWILKKKTGMRTWIKTWMCPRKNLECTLGEKTWMSPCKMDYLSAFLMKKLECEPGKKTFLCTRKNLECALRRNFWRKKLECALEEKTWMSPWKRAYLSAFWRKKLECALWRKKLVNLEKTCEPGKKTWMCPCKNLECALRKKAKIGEKIRECAMEKDPKVYLTRKLKWANIKIFKVPLIKSWIYCLTSWL